VKFAVNVPNFGAFAEPRAFVALARAAEVAGWDGLFVWDHILTDEQVPIADPWVLLTAAACETERIRLGTMVTPLPRRRPWKLARELATLDQLSNGRMILGVGIGDDSMGEYSSFGEETDERRHGAMLDEGLEILCGLWSGMPFGFEGKNYSVRETVFLPPPVQRPRIPIFVAGRWPNRRPMRRAAKWDGVVPVGRDGPLTPAQCREVIEFTHELRPSKEPFEVVVVKPLVFGNTAANHENAAAFEAAGATWFEVGFSGSDGVQRVMEAVKAGPPRR
jgi:alkanesulfonate monooxygenase SsuD/methylene tetrahydromethanopterin reductase-like flavin-dependent oxidoreductase (luciferase family)